MGFFLVLVMEQIMLAYREQSVPPPREETRALLGTTNALSLRLLQSHLRAKVVAGCGILFSCMTPLGIGLGAALAESAGPLHQLAQSVLESMAAGTFLCITYLEILPQELATSDKRILKVILLLSGFALPTGLLLIQV
uniref:Solute carrier family 39 member 1 n=1 Tax=Pipistrellus kuhlii TaxID=59472 RepID=A0A7J7ZJ76_PIPKU|nr:hypothetical protein mPipKuh1_009548 [Pipistrellus kuhlii]